GGDHYRACLEYPQPSCHQPRIIGSTQHDPVARNNPVVLCEDLGYLVGTLLHLTIGPSFAVGSMERWLLRTVLLDSAINEFSSGIENFRILHIRNREL